MELTEVVSPHVAVPVVGVLLCAFLVFAFGFKTPGQPPSFNFEEDSKRKRSKKSKVIFRYHMFVCYAIDAYRSLLRVLSVLHLLKVQNRMKGYSLVSAD
jgi:hypothetical protein